MLSNKVEYNYKLTTTQKRNTFLIDIRKKILEKTIFIILLIRS